MVLSQSKTVSIPPATSVMEISWWPSAGMAHAAPMWFCIIKSSKHNVRALLDLRRPWQQPSSHAHRMDNRPQWGEAGWNTTSAVMSSIVWLCLLGWKVVFTHFPDVAYHFSPTRWVMGQGRLLNDPFPREKLARERTGLGVSMGFHFQPPQRTAQVLLPMGKLMES